MLPIEQQVVSLELAKRLKELGVKQESYFAWQEAECRWYITRIDMQGWAFLKNNPEYGDRVISAFTVAELWSLLPRCVYVDGCPFSGNPHWPIIKRSNTSKNTEIHYSADGPCDLCAEYKSGLLLVNILAEMLIYLIENGLVKAEEL